MQSIKVFLLINEDSSVKTLKWTDWIKLYKVGREDLFLVALLKTNFGKIIQKIYRNIRGK